ncbi:Histidine kinase [metagenome]|uniref:Histidine kinase n=1 Tax=metagenome TaxID=256318 RepID=A0A2P2C1G6_9ZZZZ
MTGPAGLLAELRRIHLFDGVSDAQLEVLIGDATEVVLEPGEVLFREGELADLWWVLLEGAIDLVRHVGREDVVVRTMDTPGMWAGGFRAWDEHGFYLATGRAVRGRVLRVPAARLQARAQEWFPFAVHLIEGLYNTARSIESTVRQRESLVTLGTLAAGLAHELNNPAAAAARSARALEEESGRVMASLAELAGSEISAEQYLALDRLRREVAAREPLQDPLALADAEDRIGTWFARHGAPDQWSQAAVLAAAGADVEWCGRLVDVLGETDPRPGIAWVASVLSVTQLLTEVQEATRRVSELVAAVKTYSQVDRDSRQRVDVTQGLESSLVMLGHKLRQGVTVERDYVADLPEIEAQPGELNQVWTNLIDNAVDAMGGAGVLRVRTRFDAESVVVEVSDTGSGMSPAVIARAFDPFFTTKPVGQGTGLGLDISRRIVVERHAGEITVDSDPSGTTFRIRLPRS